MQLLSTKLIDSLNTGRRGIFFQYFVLFISLLLGIMFFGLFRIYGFVIFPDEFGYWSSAAAAIGTDWSQVASLGSYYAFGYSFILTPILYIFGGGIAAYRTAIVINVLLQCSSIFFLKGIMKILYPKMPNIDAIYCIGIAVLYPVWSFYSQMTLAESLIMFLFVLSVFLMASLFERPTVLKVFFLILTLVYMYFVHMRLIGIVASALIVLFIWALRNPKLRKFIIFIVILLAVGAAGALILKKIVQGRVYAGTSQELLAGNDYSGQIYTIKYILTGEGFRALIFGVLCKIFYLGVASLGTFYITCVYLFKQILVLKKRYRSEEGPRPKQFVCLFIFLCILFQFLITAAYMNSPNKLDSITYGRYNDYLIPIVLCLGTRQLMRCSYRLKYFLITSIISGWLCAVTIAYSIYSKLQDMHEYFVAGISYFWDVYSFDPMKDYIKAFVAGTIIFGIVLISIHLSRKRGKWLLLLNVILTVEIALTLILCTKDVYSSGEIDRIDSGIATYIQNHKDEDATVYYVQSDGRCIIDVVQFNLDDEIIQVIDGSGIDEKILSGDYLIVDMRNNLSLEENSMYSLKKESVWFRLYKKK